MTSLTTYEKLYHKAFDEHIQVAKKSQEILYQAFESWVHEALNVLEGGGKILFCGNGGSAADCQHLATELTVKFKHPRKALPALALTTDTSALTAIGNDFGFDHIFSRQIEALGHEKDMLVAISTSGTSPNVVQALKVAKAMNINTVVLTGETGGIIKDMADIALCVPSKTVSCIQEMHIFLGQLLVEAIEEAYGWSS